MTYLQMIAMVAAVAGTLAIVVHRAVAYSMERRHGTL
jgi:hypothetical protein